MRTNSKIKKNSNISLNFHVPERTWSPEACAKIFNISMYTLRVWVNADKIKCICDHDSIGRRCNVRFLAQHINERLIAMGMDPIAAA
jgi:hypothetical protein